jgi:hypothetical protein
MVLPVFVCENKTLLLMTRKKISNEIITDLFLIKNNLLAKTRNAHENIFVSTPRLSERAG